MFEARVSRPKTNSGNLREASGCWDSGNREIGGDVLSHKVPACCCPVALMWPI